MKRKKIVLCIPFNNWGLVQERLTSEWIRSRLDLFFKYTYRSFVGQTNQQFDAHLYIDRKSVELIPELLKEYPPLPENIKFILQTDSEEWIKKESLSYDLLYTVRIDSDNLFRTDFIQRLHDYEAKEDTEALVNQDGYFLSESLHQLFEFSTPSPSFFTLIYKPQEYVEGKRYVFKSHCEVITDLKAEILEGSNYMIISHGANVLIRDSILRKTNKEVTNLKEVLEQFGLRGYKL